jgi:Na+/H+ antiporter NhaD/arsenite permease-like protein
MIDEREYWQRKLALLQKEEKEWQKRDQKELEKKKQESHQERKMQMATLFIVILNVFGFLLLWGLLGSPAAAAFIWLLLWAAFGSVMETKSPKKGGQQR